MQVHALPLLVPEAQGENQFKLSSLPVNQETTKRKQTPTKESIQCRAVLSNDTELRYCQKHVIESDDDLKLELWDEDYHDRLRIALFEDSMSLLGDQRLSVENWHDLYHWVKEEGDVIYYPFSFSRCCLTAGFEPETLKESILYQLEKQKKSSDKTKQAQLF
jgi:hypothetical protein